MSSSSNGDFENVNSDLGRYWNGSGLSTNFISDGQLTASVPVASIATAGTSSVTVVNPGAGAVQSNDFVTKNRPPARNDRILDPVF